MLGQLIIPSRLVVESITHLLWNNRMPLSAESLYVKYSSHQQGLSQSAAPLSVDMHDDLMNILNLVSGVITAKYVGRVSATVSNQLTRAEASR